jgi:hypothetical protein
MNYVQTTYIYGPSKLSLRYTDDLLKQLIDKYVASNNEFTFTQVCNFILSTADQEEMLDKRPNTSYSQILLTHNDTTRICKMLWEIIWSQKLIVLFNTPQDIYHNSSETFFIVNR